MKILAIDTSSKTCGVCILEDKKEIYKEDLVTDRSHSIKLMPIIDEVFSKTSLTLNDIDLIVCDKGPGSFTGIRIGVATAKAFADSLDKPLIGVSSLEALAYSYLAHNGYICSILDAKHTNCYTALYKAENGIISTTIEPCSLSLDEALEKLKNYTNITLIGDGACSFKDDILEAIPTSEFANSNLIDSFNLGLAGYTKFKNKDFADALPMYLKKPQAQKLLEEKSNGK